MNLLCLGGTAPASPLVPPLLAGGGDSGSRRCEDLEVDDLRLQLRGQGEAHFKHDFATSSSNELSPNTLSAIQRRNQRF
jgi:hypothetical protein